MKRFLILIFGMPLFALSQDKPLMVEGVSPGLYLNHTVAPKENYYSIGRIYNISPKEIAPFNNLQLEKGLSLGQAIKIPLTTNFSQANNAAADEVLVPIYHVVQEKEGLYRISTNYNKLPLETLKQWNNIKTESVSNGTKLIVGYLKVKKDLSPLSGMAKTVISPVENKVNEVEKPVAVKEEKAKEIEKPVAVKEEKVKEVEKPLSPKAEKVKEIEKLVVKPAEKEKMVVVEPLKKDPVKEVKPTPVKEEPVAVGPARAFDGGVFKSEFDKQAHGSPAQEKGQAAIFKSTSGWEDGKYYCLHNSAAPGTILKITNNVTGKVAYAKVLDVIPDIKQNNGLLIRISNAAAEELGAVEGKFDCSVSYSK